jgi:hypothetical protein
MPQFKNILLVTDGLADEREAYKQAISRARNNRAALKVFTICPAFDKPLAAQQANVLRNLSCSLLALKPNGFVSPVQAW